MKVKSEMMLILGLAILYSSTVTAVNVADCVTNPTGKVSVDINVVGVPSPEGPNEDQGPRGYLGDTSQCENIREVEQTELDDIIKSTFTKCGIYSLNWRHVTYIDTTQGTNCPDYLLQAFNSALNKKACGRTAEIGCTNWTYPSGGSYTHVCGRARGYQFYTTDGLSRYANGATINDTYVDGLSITRGRPREHIWSYVAGHHEKVSNNILSSRCPCAGSGYNYSNKAPFVDDDYYCESGFGTKSENKIAWEDPLWDGEGCILPENTCCQRSGWFHKEVPPTTDNIEVRWCCDESRGNEDFYTDIVEIWVM